jgi:hypothetical protein
MIKYKEFKEAVSCNNVDIARFCFCANIDIKIIEQAKDTGKIPSFVGLSLMAYIDKIKNYQPECFSHENLLVQAQKHGLPIHQGQICVDLYTSSANYELQVPDCMLKHIRFF